MDLNELEPKQLVETFNQMLIDFLEACEPICSNELKTDLKIYSAKAKMAIDMRFDLLITQYVSELLPKYGNMIASNDINGLINNDYSSVASNDDDIDKILNIKSLLKSTSEDNRKIIMEYLSILNDIASTYIIKSYKK